MLPSLRKLLPPLYWRWLPPVAALIALFHFVPGGVTLDRAFLDFASRHPLRAPPLPPGSALVLVDDTTGGKRQMRTTTGFTYTAGAANTVRSFRIEAIRGAASSLTVSGVTAQSVGGSGAVVFSLSAPCNVTVNVRNVAGRLVRTIAQDKACDAGLTTLAFDGRSSRGLALPGGRYLVEVQARTEDGQQVSSLAAMEVAR